MYVHIVLICQTDGTTNFEVFSTRAKALDYLDDLRGEGGACVVAKLVDKEICLRD